MIALAVRYVAREGEAEAITEALREMADAVKAHEPDCLAWHASRSREDPLVFHLYEVYRDEAALQAHRETPHFQRLIVGLVRQKVTLREAAECDVLA